jgi:hypothetical protein
VELLQGLPWHSPLTLLLQEALRRACAATERNETSAFGQLLSTGGEDAGGEIAIEGLGIETEPQPHIRALLVVTL